MSIFLKNLDLSKIDKNGRTIKSKQSSSSKKLRVKNGRPLLPFPVKLYKMLQEVEVQGLDYIISWDGDGRFFQVHDTDAFVNDVLPKHFRCSKMKSFQRQLNFYKFHRIAGGPMEGSYSHPKFLKGEPELVGTIRRQQDPKPHVIDNVSATTDEESTTTTTPEDLNLTLLEDVANEINGQPQTRQNRRDSFENFLDSNFSAIESRGRESFREGNRLSFVGKQFFFLPVEFTDLHGV